eukprot:5072762-Heterocapsa_arctica.AAC.2
MVATSSSVVLSLTSCSEKGQRVSSQGAVGTGTDPSTSSSPQKRERPEAASAPKPASADSSIARYSSSFCRRIARRRLSLSLPLTLMPSEFARPRIQRQAPLPVGAPPWLTACAADVVMWSASVSAAFLAERCGSPEAALWRCTEGAEASSPKLGGTRDKTSFANATAIGRRKPGFWPCTAGGADERAASSWALRPTAPGIASRAAAASISWVCEPPCCGRDGTSPEAPVSAETS